VRRLTAVLVFVVTATGVYTLLVALMLIATFASGGGISCENTCTGVQQFFDDAWPYSLVVGIALSGLAGSWAARRMLARSTQQK